MVNNRRKNEKGFTLVEVIVVAVIVAVLALVGIQLYQGYATEARRNTAENLAASAAGFLQTVLNTRDSAYMAASCASPLEGPAEWNPVLDVASNNSVTFRCPADCTIYIEGDSVRAVVHDISSIGSYRYR